MGARINLEGKRFGRLVAIRYEDNFYADMGPRPSKDHSIERIDSDGDYCPENCRWATSSEQAMNRSTSRMITCDGVTKNISEWSKITGVSRRTISDRLKRGWDVGSALKSPARQVGKTKSSN